MYRVLSTFMTFCLISSSLSAFSADLNDKTVTQDFLQGKRTFEPEAAHITLDSETVRDLELDEVGLAFMNNHPWTPMGLNRMKWLLRHPYTDSSEILLRQQTIKALAENEDLLKTLSALFEDIYKLGPKDWREGKYDEKSWFQVFNSVDFWERNQSTGDKLILQTLIESLVPILFSAPPLALALHGAMNGVTWHWRAGAALVLLAEVAFYYKVNQSDNTSSNENIQMNLLQKVINDSERSLTLLQKTNIPELSRFSEKCSGSCSTFYKSLLAASYGDGTLAEPTRILNARKLLRPFARASVRSRKVQIAKLLGFLGELEVLTQIATVYHDNKERMVFPKLDEGSYERIDIEEGEHPLNVLEQKDSVPNSIKISTDPFLQNNGDSAKTIIITGPNTGGKTIYLREAGVTQILGQMGFPVFAKNAVISPRIRVWTMFKGKPDSTSAEASTFRRQGDRGAEGFHLADKGEPILYLADEIFGGTSPQEQLQAEGGAVLALHNDYPRVMLMDATHIREIGKLQNDPRNTRPGFTNVQVPLNGYKIIPGISQVYNALDVLNEATVPHKVIEHMKTFNNSSEKCDEKLRDLAS